MYIKRYFRLMAKQNMSLDAINNELELSTTHNFYLYIAKLSLLFLKCIF